MNNEPTHFESLYPPETRAEEIGKIFNFVKEGNSVQLLGLPGTGRSTILRLLAYNRNVRIKHVGENQKWYHFVLCNFSEVRKKPLIDVEKFIFLNLVDSLRERLMREDYQKANEIFKESISFNDELVLLQGLKKTVDLLAIEKELTIVFLFDRFEEYVPVLTNEFFLNLRTLRSRAKYRFSVVFSTGRLLEDILEPSLFADFYEFLTNHNIYVNLYDKEGADFRISYLEKVTEKKISKEILDEILNVTGGHGKLTRIAAEVMLSSEGDSLRSKVSPSIKSFKKVTPLTKSNLETLFLSQNTIQGALLEIWNWLTPSEQNYLVSSVKSLESSKGDSLRSKRSKVSPFEENNNAIFLEDIQLLKNGELTIPLFEKFISEVSSLPARSESMTDRQSSIIVFDPNTNDIKKGDVVLSEKLTSLEFKLLKFLIGNQDKIIPREEIINAVWQDLKSQEGITDQALDQLIFRLRKKIENDTNNSKHLLTIKGRGLRFKP